MSLGKIVSGWADKLGKMKSEPASKEWLAKHGKQSSKGIALDRAKVSKEELRNKYTNKQIAKHGGVDKYQKHLQDQRSSIDKAFSKYKEPSEKEKSDHQSKIGKGYHE